MSKSLATIAIAFGMLAAASGSAWAEGGCGSYAHSGQTVAVETQTTGQTLAQSAATTATQQTPKPETKAN